MDGTLHEVINGIMPIKEKRILYVPTGTVNDFGSYLKLNKNYKETFKLLNTEPFLIDIGKLNGSFFVYTFAIGQFTNISYGNYNKDLKRCIGKFYYFLKAFKELFNYKKIEVVEDGKYFIILVLNTFRIASFKIRRPNKLNDGKLNIIFFGYSNIINLINLFLFLFFKILFINVSYRKSDSLIFKTKDKVEYNLDGEYGGVSDEFNISILKEAFYIYIPKESRKYF